MLGVVTVPDERLFGSIRAELRERLFHATSHSIQPKTSSQSANFTMATRQHSRNEFIGYLNARLVLEPFVKERNHDA